MKPVIDFLNYISLKDSIFNYFRGLRFSELPKEVLSDKDSIRIIDREIVNTIARRKVSAFEAKKLGLFVSDIEIKNLFCNIWM